MKKYFETGDLNIDLGLIDARDNEDLPWVRRALAGASVGMAPNEAYELARALYEAVVSAQRKEVSGKKALADILGANGHDYQRALWFSMAGRHYFSPSGELHWLLSLLEARKVLSEGRFAADKVIASERSPYGSFEPYGPLGVFPVQFELGSLAGDIDVS